ncbi:MAG: carbohydrate binding family 9 domain-containing protein [Bacteroidetes bacterium]|nr:carbohydrate binding family 9 domain-containing protein [Bacteroidota bacterium]
MKTLLIFLLCFSTLTFAQNQPGTQLHIKRAKTPITIDGKLDEPDWTEADVAGNWFLNYPVDTARAPFQTEARLTFNDHFLYVSLICQDDSTRDLINSLRRDFDYERNDNVGITLGPYNDRINGFFFVLTPKGVQMEGTIAGGGIVPAGSTGEEIFNAYWDNKWYSKVIRHKDKWIAEVAIPFKSFRYKSGLKEWNIAFDRNDKKRNYKSSWIRTPIQFNTGAFAFSGQLVWDDPVPPARTNISFIPFVTANTSQDSEANPVQKSSDMQAGFDAKVAITPSLNLDLTANPDFSQVEVDQQVINLTRFEFKFPERRTFFLENSDLFDRAGFPEARIFFSRRIGLIRDSSGLYKRVPIAYGARLSGSLNRKWRMSVLNMQTKEKLDAGLPAQNFAVATVQRNFWRQSNFSVTFVNKQSLGVDPSDSTKYYHESIFKPVTDNGKTYLKANTYNRVIDADLELLSADNKWYGSGFAARSFDDFNQTETGSYGGYAQYSVKKVNVQLSHSYIGKNFNAEAGYVPSHNVYPGQFNYSGSVNYRAYPAGSFIVYHGPGLVASQTYIPGGTLTDRSLTLNYSFSFLNTAMLTFSTTGIFQQMTNEFNPVDPTQFITFKPGEQYSWKMVTGMFQSNSRHKLNYTIQSTYGGFYNGTNFNANGQINFRYQPYGNVSLRFDYNDVRLPNGYGQEKLFLIGPRVDLTFTDKLFLTTYVQYNNRIDNVNINARFQWRYQPASDLFIVYTENYLPETMASKNRALVLKLTYWLNL